MTDLKERYQPKLLSQITTARQVFGARFVADDLLMSGGYDALVHRWKRNGDKFEERAPLHGHHGWVSALTVSPGGQQVFTADSWGEIRCWSADESVTEAVWSNRTAHDGWIRALAVNNAGTVLTSAGRDGLIQLWSTETGALIRELTALDGNSDYFSVLFHPTDGSVITGDFFGRVRQWNAGDGSLVREYNATELFVEHRLQQVGGARCLALNSDASILAVAGTRPKNGSNVQGTPLVLFFETASGKQVRSLELGATSDVYVCDLAYHRDGFLMAVTSGNPGTGQVVFVEADAEKPFFTEKKLPNCHALSLSQSGLQFAVTATSKGSNGNGRRLDKDGNYLGNSSPIHIFEFESKL